jgi:hypothetical protein
LVVLVGGLLLVASCGPEWELDPDVQGARTACAGLRRKEHTTCVEQEAVARLNPDVCHLAGIAVDSACLQAVYEAADDPGICDRVYLQGAASNCRAWYADRTPEPRLGERWRPRGEYLDDCTPGTERSLAAFEEALATEEPSFLQLCQQVGRPDWQTGSGLIIFIYELDDGSEVWLGFGGLESLNYAIQVLRDGQKVDLLADR